MPELPELTVLLHQRSQPLGGRVRRAVIDVDDLVGPAAIERTDDFRNQRRNVVGLVAHRHYDGNGNRTSVGSSQIGTRLVGLKKTRNRAYLVARRRPLLWGESAPGNPFEASRRGSNQGHNAAVVPDRKP